LFPSQDEEMSQPEVASRVCVVGSGIRFLSGISYYTVRLAEALSARHHVSVILMRRLLPRHLYPGRARVGAQLTRLEYPSKVPVFDGVDWYWIPSLFRALRFLSRQSPEVLVLQWWSGTVLHSYLALTLAAKRLGALVVIEFHEVLDTGELERPLAGAYARRLGRLLVRLADAYVVHSEFDRAELASAYQLPPQRITAISHGPFDHHRAVPRETPIGPDGATPAQSAPGRGAKDSACNLLSFGTIRPFKGVEDLIEAFDSLPPESVERLRLTVVGETWEGWTKPAEMIAASRYRDRITFVNRYVTDDEVTAFFGDADVVVLPYHRSSASGPLHIAMSHGLPTVVTTVGGLVDAVSGYEGAVLVAPGQPDELARALLRAADLRGQRFADPHSWQETVRLYQAVFDRLPVSEDLAV
jgi:glycosyltransferase involved in cell wall biosynthesis